jgi:hypothetical protein
MIVGRQFIAWNPVNDIVWKCSQGLKPLAESRHPFGISPRVPSGQQTVSTRPQNRLHIRAIEYWSFGVQRVLQ